MQAARPVLRGPWRGNAPGLPDSCRIRRRSGGSVARRICCSGCCRIRAGGVAGSPRPRTSRTWSRGCTRSPPAWAVCRSAGGSTGWRRCVIPARGGSPPASAQLRCTIRSASRSVRAGMRGARARWRRARTRSRNAGGARWAMTSPSRRRRRAWTGCASGSTPVGGPATGCAPRSASWPTPSRCARCRRLSRRCSRSSGRSATRRRLPSAAIDTRCCPGTPARP